MNKSEGAWEVRVDVEDGAPLPYLCPSLHPGTLRCPAGE